MASKTILALALLPFASSLVTPVQPHIARVASKKRASVVASPPRRRRAGFRVVGPAGRDDPRRAGRVGLGESDNRGRSAKLRRGRGTTVANTPRCRGVRGVEAASAKIFACLAGKRGRKKRRPPKTPRGDAAVVGCPRDGDDVPALAEDAAAPGRGETGA